MKKYISLLLLLFLLISSTSNAFGLDKSESQEVQEKNKIHLWDNPFFDYHQSFSNLWRDSFWDFSFPRISIANNYPLDLKEQDNGLIATIDIPNFEPDNIEIEVKNDRWLIIQGKKNDASSEEKNDDKKYYYRERSSGSFLRQFLLPYSVDTSATKAIHKNGVLTVILPKKSIDPDTSDNIPISIE